MDAAKREARLKQWHGSGLKLAKSARKVGISPNTLKQWDKKIGIEKILKKEPMPQKSGMDVKGNMKGMEVVKIGDLKVKSIGKPCFRNSFEHSRSAYILTRNSVRII
ncbi:MAG: hypothetical protein IJT59_01505 [Desulfovibrionaceae bacterium]|nr:hypothetical protein [Desulfovibrionaceae bacterium]